MLIRWVLNTREVRSLEQLASRDRAARIAFSKTPRLSLSVYANAQHMALYDLQQRVPCYPTISIASDTEKSLKAVTGAAFPRFAPGLCNLVTLSFETL